MAGRIGMKVIEEERNQPYDQEFEHWNKNQWHGGNHPTPYVRLLGIWNY
jgi:hypothetical protein